jgi:hypothetical protein
MCLSVYLCVYTYTCACVPRPSLFLSLCTGQVDCSGAEAQGFCRSRQPSSFPHVELFMPADSGAPLSSASSSSPSAVRVQVRKLGSYYPSVYGLREFLRSSGVDVPS